MNVLKIYPWIVILFLINTSALFAQPISGTFTVGGLNPSYQTITKFIEDITQKGIDGPVIVNVRDGIYNEHINLPYIQGSSMQNTITFQSEALNSQSVTLLYEPSFGGNQDRSSIAVDSLSNVVFQYLTVKNTSSSGNLIDVYSSVNFVFRHNLVEGELHNGTNLLYYEGDVNGIQITNNIFKNGETALHFDCSNSLIGSGKGYSLTISNNEFTEQQASSLKVFNLDSVLVLRNTIISQSEDIKGILFSGVGTFSALKENKILLPSGGDGMRIENCEQITLANNFISIGGNNYASGIYIYDSYDINILYNSINIYNENNQDGKCLSIFYGGDIRLFNNILANTGGGYSIYNYYNSILQSNHNNLYTKGSTLCYIDESNLSDITQWRDATPGFDSNSLSINPDFESTISYKVNCPELNGSAIPLDTVLTDIEGKNRNSQNPDIGAFEFNLKANDIAITELVSPELPVGQGGHDVIVLLRNCGHSSVSSISITIELNGLRESVNWTGQLESLSSISYSMGSKLFKRGKNTLKFWIDGTNLGTDENHTNDTLKNELYSSFSGTYTIGGVDPDFISINEAVNALKASNVITPLLFQIRDGFYNEQIVLENIEGVNSTNTITFTPESGDSTKVIVEFLSTKPTPEDDSGNENPTPTSKSRDIQDINEGNFTLLLKGASYFNFDGLTLKSKGLQFGRIIDIRNGANHNTFSNCIFEGQRVSENSSQHTLVYSGNFADNYNEFISNRFENGGIALGLVGEYEISWGEGGQYKRWSNSEKGLIIKNNSFLDQYAVGVDLANHDTLVLSSNSFRTTSDFRGYSAITGNLIYKSSEIIKNKILLTNGGTGISLFNRNNGGGVAEVYGRSRAYGQNGVVLVANNFISISGSNKSVGVLLEDVNDIRFNFNSINILSKNTQSTALYTKYINSFVSQNNIFSNLGGGFAVNFESTWGVDESSYNNYFSIGKSIAKWGDTVCDSLKAFQIANNQDVNSISVNPFFNSSFDLHTSQIALNGKAFNATGVSDDIDGELRQGSPDIGADEFVPANVDAGVVGLEKPSIPFVGGVNDIVLRLKNFGAENIQSLKICWEFNGVKQDIRTWTGSLSSGKEVDFIVGSPTFSNYPNQNKIKAWVYEPNGVNDGNPNNDTLSFLKYPSLSGEYTIGGVNPDFAKIIDAINFVADYGVAGNITFKIRPGLYNEQVLVPEFPGASGNSVVTFTTESENIKDVVISFDPTNSVFENYLLQFSGASNTIFKNIVFENISTSKSTILEFIGKINNARFLNCLFKGITDNYNSKLITVNGALINGLHIIGNSFENGRNAISLDGDYNNYNNVIVINGNTFTNQSVNAIEISNASNVTIDNNSISNGGNGSFNAISLNSVKEKLNINYNNLNLRNSGNGVNISNSELDFLLGGLISNNFINFDGTYFEGIKIYYSKNLNIINNTLRINSTEDGASSISVDYGCNNIEVINNILAHINKGNPLYIYNKSSINECDFNDIITKNGFKVKLQNYIYNSIVEWQKGTGFDNHSLSVFPSFVSDNDLHVKEVLLNGAAKPTPLISLDFDHQPRNPAKPDIGADEFDINSLDAEIKRVASPVAPIKSGKHSIGIEIKNTGSDPIKTITLEWTLNQNQQVPINWKGDINTGGNALITTDSILFQPNQTYHIKLKIKSPNGLTDINPVNDTISFTVSTSLEGVFTIGGLNPDFKTITEAINRLNNAGISADVKFNLRNGVYRESVVIDSIRGAKNGFNVVFTSESKDSSQTVIEYDTDLINHLVNLQNAQNITFSNLTFQALGINQSRLFLISGNCENISVNNSILNGAITTNNFNTTNSLIFAENAGLKNIQLRKNILNNASQGIYFSGITSAKLSNINIEQNTFNNQLCAALIIYNIINPVINKNIVNSNSDYYYFDALRFGGVESGGYINSNSILINRGNCINLTSNQSNYYSSIKLFNNFLRSKNGKGIYLYYTSYVTIYSNNILIDTGGTPLDIGYSSNSIYLANNILSNIGGGNVIYSGYGNPISSSDYNDFYTSGSSLIYYGNPYSNLAQWQTQRGFDKNSLSIDPLFVSKDDLHVRQVLLKAAGKEISEIATDIDGQIRAKKPDIGADEFELLSVDAGVSSIDNIASGLNPIKVYLNNFGKNDLVSAKIAWSFDGIFQSGLDWNGSLKSRDSALVTLGTKQIEPGVSYTIKSWSFEPNGIVDPIPSNDTSIVVGKIASLSGEYTIGGASPDYPTFNAAIDALKSLGISNKVIFNVRDGNYNEQIEIPQISGANSNESILFRSESNDSSKVILQYNSSYSNNYILRLKKAKGVVFKKIGFKPLNTSYGKIIDIQDGELINFTNCKFEGINTTLSSSDLSLIYSGSGKIDNLLFERCYFVNGSEGISFNSQGVNLKVIENVFNNQYYRAIVVSSVSDALIVSNNISTQSTYCCFNGICISSCLGSFAINKNKVNILNGGTGIYVRTYSSDETTNLEISNNFINVTGFYYSFGLDLSNSTNVNIYSNSINIIGNASDSKAITISDSKLKLFNNNIVNAAKGYCVYKYNSSISSVLVANNNNYYTTGPNIGYWDGNITSMAAWKAVTSNDANSISINPSYKSNSDLHVSELGLIKKGLVLSEIFDDIDNDQRPLNGSTIGADEIIPLGNDAGILSLNPVKSGSSMVFAVLVNYGNDTLRSVNINWKLNNAQETPISWTGKLSKGDTVKVNLAIKNFVRGQVYNAKIWSSLPNNGVDANNVNDTLNVPTFYSSLSGIYTIGSTGCDFNSFQSAANALESFGVYDTVEFRVKSNIYNEQVRIKRFSGLNKPNTVKFISESGKPQDVNLVYASTASDNNFTIQFDNVSGITFKGITIKANGASYGRAVELKNTCENINFSNNIIVGTASNNTSYNFALVYSYGGFLSKINLISNTFLNGSYGAYFNLFKGSLGVKVKGNTFTNQYYCGGTFSYISDLQINDNSVQASNLLSDYIGIDINYCQKSIAVSNNKIIIPKGENGIKIYCCTLENADESIIANNFISIKGDYYTTGIYLSSVTNLGLFYNSVYTNGTGNDCSSIALSSCSKIKANNNNFYNVGNGYAVKLYNPDNLVESDYNNIFSDNRNLIYTNKLFKSLDEYRALYNKESHSISYNPSYFSTSDLHTNEIILNNRGKLINGIATDIDGEARSAQTPDIGADEFNPNLLDAGVISVSTVDSLISVGSNLVYAEIRNFGSDTIKTVKINWALDASAYETINWSGVLKPSEIKRVILGSKNFTYGQEHTLAAWTSLPNGLQDLVTLNDTAKVKGLYTALDGTYTIGGVIPDFSNIGNAITYMRKGGVKNKVTFNVRDGIYNEQVVLPYVKGASSSKGIIFKSESGDSTKVIISFNANNSNNFTIQLKNAVNVSINRITLVASNTTYGRVAEILNTKNINIEQCVFQGIATTSAGDNLSLIYSSNSQDSSLTIKNSKFLNGSYGIYHSGNSSNNPIATSIQSNIFENQYNTAIYLYYHKLSRIKANSIKSNLNNAKKGIYIYSCSSVYVGENLIDLDNNGYGIYMYYCSSDGKNKSFVVNNMISVKGTTGVYGLYMYNNNFANVFHNTIKTTSDNSSSLYSEYDNNLNIKNNNIINANNGYALNIRNSNGNVLISDFNNIYSKGVFGYWNQNIANLDSWRTIVGRDIHSLSVNPLFLSPTDLHLRDITLNDAGTNIPDVTVDLDGDIRSTLHPDIGADEFSLVFDDDAGVTSIDKPSKPFSSGNNNVVVVLRNFGRKDLTSALIVFNVNGNLQPTFNWTGLIKPGERDTIIIGQYNFVVKQKYSITSWTELPNGIVDPFNINDTVKVDNIFAAYGGIYTIGGSNPDFVSFTEAINSLKIGGVVAPIAFKVRKNSYYERLIISDIIGISKSNGILFQSEDGDSTGVVLGYAASYGDNYVIQIKNIGNISFEKITIKALSSSYGRIVELNNTSNIAFKGCLFEGQNTNSTSDNHALVLSNESSGLALTNNLFNCGSIGIFLNNSDITKSSNNIITDNSFIEQSGYAINATKQNAIAIRRNKIESNKVDITGVALVNAENNVCIEKNKIILGNGKQGINISTFRGRSATKGLIANNFIAIIGNSEAIGVIATNPNYLNLFNNNINVVSNNPNSAALYLTNTFNFVSMSNNIINSGNGYSMYIPTNNSLIISNYNNLYSKSGVVVNNLGKLVDFVEWISGTNDKQSISLNPYYKTNTDLHVQQISLDGKGIFIPEIVTDIDDEVRNVATPDIGADEFVPNSKNDAGILSLNDFNLPLNPGNKSIQVVIKNYGVDTLRSAKIFWKVNNAHAVTFNWFGSVNPGSTDTVSVGIYNFAHSTKYKFTAWSDKPNSIDDKNAFNDSLFIDNIYAGLEGTFTIGGVNPDFKSFTEAVNTLKIAGINKSVTFQVRNGNYYEQFVIPNIKGTSQNAQVLFTSELGDSSKVVIIRNTNSNPNCVVRFDNSKYITFKKISIFLQYYSGNCIELINGSEHISILSNFIKSNYLSENLIYSDSKSKSIKIHRNYLLNGANAVNINGLIGNLCDSILISQNTILNQGSSGISLRYIDSFNISQNTIFNQYGDYSYKGMFLTNCKGNNSISGNNITCNYYGYGIYLNEIEGSEGKNTVLSNNFIMMNGDYSYNGIASENSNYIKLYYNSINTSKSSNYSNPVYLGSGNNYRILNNIIATYGTGSALKVNSNVQFESEYNNLFAKGTKLVTYSSDYSNLAAWKAASSKDIHSISLDPLFTSPTDLHINEMQLNGKATPIVGINIDIDNQPRNTVTPDIGADEFVPPTQNDAGIISIVGPERHFNAGENTIKVVLKNFGSDTLRSVDINLHVNYNPTLEYTWTGKIPTGKTDTVTIGKFSFAKYGKYNLKFVAKAPNHLEDEDQKNDTISARNLCPMLSGIVTIGGQSPNFADVSSAASYLNYSGVNGPVNFIIRRGQYLGQFVIKKIYGASDKNSIVFQSEVNDSLSVAIKNRIGSTLVMDSSQNVTFKYLTFVKASWSGNNVQLNTVKSVAFKNCNFEIEKQQYDDCHIKTTGKSANIGVFNCNFKDGRNAISIIGKGKESSGISILKNLFTNQKEIPLYFDSFSNVEVKYNEISTNVYNDNSFGIKAISIYDTLNFSFNKIDLPKGKGIGLINYQGIPSFRGLISNNFVSVGGENISTGIELIGCNLLNIYNNSIHINGSSSEGSCLMFENNSNLGILNNILFNSGLGYTYYTQNSAGIANLDYNAIFSKGSSLAYWTRKIMNLSDLRSVTGMEQHSSSVDPLFNSNTDLHILQILLDKAGIPIPEVKLDIDSEPRDGITPDIGADEFVNRLNDIGITALIPSSGCALTNNEKVKITIQNFGVNPQSNFDVFYKLNEIETVKENIGSVVINPGNSYTYTFTKPIDLSSIGYYKILAWHMMSNDEQPKNDTIAQEITNSPSFKIVVSPDTSICPGSIVKLFVTGGSSYQWSNGSTKNSIEVSPTKTTTYKVLAQNVFGCSTIDSVKVNVYSSPEKPVLIPEGSTTFCFGGSVTIRSSIEDNIRWSTGETLPSIKVSTSGNYTVTHKDTHGCSTISDGIQVKTEEKPFIKASKTTICLDEIVELKAENAIIYNWSTGETQQTISVKPNSTTKYKLVARTELGCTFKDSVTINVVLSPATPLPVSNMSPADGQKELSLPLTLSWEGTDNARYYDLYLWKSSGSKPSSPIAYNTSSIRYKLENVSYGESYKWQVVAKNACVETQGVVQSFGLRKLPDIKVTHVQVPQSVYSESSFDVTWEVTNIGDGNTAYQHWKDYIYLSEDTILGQDHFLGEIPNMTYLVPQQSYSKTQTFLLPRGITGNFYILVVADKGSTLLESIKLNNNSRNILPMWVKLNPPPDLRVESIITPDDVYSEHKYTIGWTVKNFGEKKATPGSWVDEVLISKDINKSSVYSLGKVTHTGELSPDSSYKATAYVEIPKEIFGTYYIYIRTDVHNNVYEHAWDYNNMKQSDSIRVLLTPPADLIVSDIIMPQQVTNRTKFNISWKDFNQGASNNKVTGWDDRVYLSKSPIFNLSDALVYPIHKSQNGILAVTGYDMSIPVSLPKLIKPDNYYVYIETDIYNKVFEFDKENNNILRSDTTIKVITEPWADLQVLSVTVPDSAAAGDMIPISFTVINKGPAETDLSQWDDEVFIATDLSLLYSIKMGEFKRIGSVASGGSYTFIGNVKIPDAMPIIPLDQPLGSGNYVIVVRTVKDTIVYEHKFTKNNKNQSNLIFIRPSDLEIQEISTPLTAYSGDVIPVQWVVKNKSYQTPASYWREGFTEFDCEPKKNSSKSGPVRRNEVYTINYSYKIPEGYSGPLVLEAVADKCNFNSEKIHANNYKKSNPINVILTPPCDLTIQSLTTPNVVTAGQPVEMSWIVKNSASGSTRSGGWTDLLYLSNNENLKYDRRNDIGIAEPYHQGNITGGQSYEVKDNFTIPIDAVGNYFLKVETDYYEREYEHNAENNNLRVKQIKVVQPPPSDLIVTSVTAPVKAVAGEKVTVNWIVKNLGPNKAMGYMVDMIYFSRDSVWDIDDVLFAESPANIDLDINKTLNRSVTTELTGTSVGDYYVIVRTDNRNNIYEVDNTNNSKSTSSTVNIEVQELKLNVLTSNTLNNNIPLYYRIEIPQNLENESLLIQLKADTLNGINELYLRYNDVPTRSTFDFGFDSPFAGNQEVIAPELKPGTYYLMVYGMNKEKKFQPISLFARILDFEIRSVKANQGGNSGKVTIQVNGSKFDIRMKLKLENPSDTVRTDSIMISNSIKLFGTFNLKGKTEGLYDVKGENYQGKIAILRKSFEIVKGSTTELGVVNRPPSFGFPGLIVKTTIEFVNAGNIDIKTPVITMRTWDGSLLGLTVDDAKLGKPEINIPLHELNGPQDMLRPGAYGNVVVYVYVKNQGFGFDILLPNDLVNSDN